ncbi:MAG TPA: hypothetical protein VFM54_07890, partial [Micromonosporaceae bacterium]|nr:hypothetical protein [Micromonosporaceae bacterium]
MTTRPGLVRAGRGPARALVLGLLAGLLAGPVATAQPAFAVEDVGYAGPATTGDGSAATGEKPQSKLWWNDGSWWSVLFHTGSQTHRIFRLDLSTQHWVDT